MRCAWRSPRRDSEKNLMMLSPAQELDYSYWSELTTDDRAVPLKPMLPAELLLQRAQFDPEHYGQGAGLGECHDWCSGEIKIDHAAADAAAVASTSPRTTTPTGARSARGTTWSKWPSWWGHSWPPRGSSDWI